MLALQAELTGVFTHLFSNLSLMQILKNVFWVRATLSLAHQQDIGLEFFWFFNFNAFSTFTVFGFAVILYRNLRHKRRRLSLEIGIRFPTTRCYQTRPQIIATVRSGAKFIDYIPFLVWSAFTVSPIKFMTLNYIFRLELTFFQFLGLVFWELAWFSRAWMARLSSHFPRATFVWSRIVLP